MGRREGDPCSVREDGSASLLRLVTGCEEADRFGTARSKECAREPIAGLLLDASGESGRATDATEPLGFGRLVPLQNAREPMATFLSGSGASLLRSMCL